MPKLPSDAHLNTGDHLDEVCSLLSNADYHGERLRESLEDGVTTWDQRVKDLHGAIALLAREANTLREQYRKNNPR